MQKIFVVFTLALFMMLTGCSGNQPKNQDIAPQVTPKDASTSQQRVFTLNELKNYNGQNGNPAYVAVNGVVYDVTKSPKWKNGLHSACSNSTYAGADFSEIIKSSPHGANIMNKFPTVGTIQK